MTFLADSDVALVLDRPKTIRISREGGVAVILRSVMVVGHISRGLLPLV